MEKFSIKQTQKYLNVIKVIDTHHLYKPQSSFKVKYDQQNSSFIEFMTEANKMFIVQKDFMVQFSSNDLNAAAVASSYPLDLCFSFSDDFYFYCYSHGPRKLQMPGRLWILSTSHIMRQILEVRQRRCRIENMRKRFSVRSHRSKVSLGEL